MEELLCQTCKIYSVEFEGEECVWCSMGDAEELACGIENPDQCESCT